MRSPRTAPPVNGLLGSTATTPTVLPCCRITCRSRSTSELLPLPGGPVIPTRCARPVWGWSSVTIWVASGSRSSARLIALASALTSPCKREAARLISNSSYQPSPAQPRPRSLPSLSDSRPPGDVRQVGPIADPLGRNDRQELGHLVQRRPVSRAQTAELSPRLIGRLAPVASLYQAIARLVEFFAFDDRVGRLTEAEKPGDVLHQVPSHFVHQAGRPVRDILQGTQDQRGRIHDGAERVEPGLVVVTRPEPDQEWVGEVALQDRG